MTTNEAAERLRHNLAEPGPDRSEDADELRTSLRLLDEALAAERRATIDRIRERINKRYHTVGGASRTLHAILDEEAAR